MKQYLLYNPKSGSGTGKKLAEEKQAAASCESVLQDITAIGNAKEFFSNLADDDRVILFGGDGTIFRLVNDFDGYVPSCELLFCSVGTGNDFLRDVGTDREDRLVLLTPYLKDLPKVTVNGKTYRFLNNVGFGIDGYCTEEGDRQHAAGKTDVNYAGIAIKGMLGKFGPRQAKVTIDGKTVSFKDAWLVPTMNGRCYGGGMYPTPSQNRLNPEHTVSVMVFYGKSRLKTLIAFPSIFKGEHIKHTKQVTVLQGNDIFVEFDRPTPLQIDGETISGVTSYEVHTER